MGQSGAPIPNIIKGVFLKVKFCPFSPKPIGLLVAKHVGRAAYPTLEDCLVPTNPLGWRRHTLLSVTHKAKRGALELFLSLKPITRISPKESLIGGHKRSACRACKACEPLTAFPVVGDIFIVVRIGCWHKIGSDSLFFHPKAQGLDFFCCCHVLEVFFQDNGLRHSSSKTKRVAGHFAHRDAKTALTNVRTYCRHSKQGRVLLTFQSIDTGCACTHLMFCSSCATELAPTSTLVTPL